MKKKKKKAKKGEQTKAAGARLKGFVDWTDPTASEPTEEREDNIFGLAAGFAEQMRKLAASS